MQLQPLSKTALIIEDHPLYRDALTHLLHALVGAQNTQATHSAEEGVQFALRLPNLAVILLDLGLPGLGGVEAIAAFRRLVPEVPIIVVSASEHRHDAMAALHAGAIAFVSKAISGEAMSDVVRRVLTGQLTEFEWHTPNDNTRLHVAPLPKLTSRQLETLALLAQGCSNKVIARRLDLAEITIKVHVSALFRVLDVVNRTQAVTVARRLGMIVD